MPLTFGFETYLSPFTKRYGSPEMRELFSDLNYFGLQREVWSALAAAQAKYGLVSQEELDDIQQHAGREHIDIDRIRELDKNIRHDLMAHVKAYAEQCKVGGKKIHYGATSMDIEDNIDISRSLDAADIIITRLVNTLYSMRPYMENHASTPCVAWTHLQPAGYTTLGYRFANYAQDLILALQFLEFVVDNHLKGKGMKGIVGTSSSYMELLGDTEKVAGMESFVMSRLGIEAFPVTTQVYPRIIDYTQFSALSALAAAAHKFALDLRLLSSPVLGEMYKVPSPEKVGSSAAPWKVFNPTEAERINSLARYVSAMPAIAWTNAANNMLERTLDDSANRRIIMAESYLASDQIMIEYDKILREIRIREEAMKRNLRNYGTFMKTEPLMMEAVKRGADRQEFHESIRRHVMPAYEELLESGSNPLPEMLKIDEYVRKFFTEQELDGMLSTEKELDKELDDAAVRTKQFLELHLCPTLEKYHDKLGLHPEPEF